MINHILLICSLIIIYEFIKFINFKNIIKNNINIYKKIIKLLTYKNISDFRKEKLILHYSKSLFIVSIKILAVITSILTFMFILNLISSSFLNLLISISGIVEIFLFFIIYHNFRNKINAKL